jgi:hypothetical protein
VVQGQPGENVSETPSQQITAWWLMPVIPAMAKSLKQEDYSPGLPEQKRETLSLK